MKNNNATKKSENKWWGPILLSKNTEQVLENAREFTDGKFDSNSINDIKTNDKEKYEGKSGSQEHLEKNKGKKIEVEPTPTSQEPKKADSHQQNIMENTSNIKTQQEGVTTSTVNINSTNITRIKTHADGENSKYRKFFYCQS